MNKTNTIKCKKCGHDKNDHCKWVRNPDFNYSSDKELNACVCKISTCGCKFFEKKDDNVTECFKNLAE